jgi:hypothetical protein
MRSKCADCAACQFFWKSSAAYLLCVTLLGSGERVVRLSACTQDRAEAIDGLLNALADLQQVIRFPVSTPPAQAG